MANEEPGSSGTTVPSLFPILPGVQGVGSRGQSNFSSFSSAGAVASLFPISGAECERVAASEQDIPVWLQNASFSESLLPAPSVPVWTAEETTGEPPITAGLEEPLSEDGSYDSAEDRRRRRRKKRRKRKQEEEKRSDRHGKKEESYVDEKAIGSLAGSAAERKAKVVSWADPKVAQKEYFFDVRGDRDNLAFGSLYRLDVAQYRRHWTDGASKLIFFSLAGKKRKFDIDEDDDEGFTAAGNTALHNRYFYPKIVSLERQGNYKRLRIFIQSSVQKRKHPTPAGEAAYVALQVEDGEKLRSEMHESWEDSINRKTKEFNQLTREKAHDESVWVAFAQFQDQVIQASHKKGVIQQAVDKKISILEKALEQHPDSEEMLLLYLQTCKIRLDASVLLTKWEQAVRKHAGSARIWREYIRVQRAQFSQFTVSAMRKVYLQALRALVANRNQLRVKEIFEAPESQEYKDSEQSVVSMFLDFVTFEWQTGYHELAVGMLQGQLEYSLFAPPIQLSESNKRRLFEAFWDGGAARVGEEGALGWALWLEKEEEQLQVAKTSEVEDLPAQEGNTGGWTGWSDPSAMTMEDGLPKRSPEEAVDTSMDDMEDMQMEDGPQEEDEAALLERLGLSLDLEKEVQVDDPSVWKKWAEEEARRDSCQWAPVRKHTENGPQIDELDTVDENLERMVLFEDIREILFSLHTEQGRFSLVGQSIDLCEGPLREWCCTNSGPYKRRWDAVESLSSSLLRELLGLDDYEEEMQSDGVMLEQLVGSKNWYEQCEGRSKFVQNLLGLLRPIYSHHKGVLDSVLKMESITAAVQGQGAKDSENAARVLAKRLLKSNRQDHLLLGVYGCLEASFGNIEVARKVFDTTITSLSALSNDAQLDAPILYLAYADVEMAELNVEQVPSRAQVGHQRLFHILCYAGAGGTFSPFAGCSAVSSALLLRAQRGFSEQMQRIRQCCHGADLTERGAATIACAALFELVRSGWEAASSVFEEGLAMILPVKRQRSLECEKLMQRYVQMLEDKRQHVKPAHVRRVVLRGLVQYPLNPRVLKAYVCHSGLISNLRRVLDDEMSRSPSTLLGLFALSCELGKPSAAHRIHSLLERALERNETEQSVVLWRFYLAFELEAGNTDGARRIFFRAIHACPWSKSLWMDGFIKLRSVLSAKEQSEFLDIMRVKELRIRTDIYEILLEQAE